MLALRGWPCRVQHHAVQRSFMLLEACIRSIRSIRSIRRARLAVVPHASASPEGRLGRFVAGVGARARAAKASRCWALQRTMHAMPCHLKSRTFRGLGRGAARVPCPSCCRLQRSGRGDLQPWVEHPMALPTQQRSASPLQRSCIASAECATRRLQSRCRRLHVGRARHADAS